MTIPVSTPPAPSPAAVRAAPPRIPGNPELQRQLWLRWGPWHGLWLLLFVALAAALVAVLAAPGLRVFSVLYAAMIAMCLAPVFPGVHHAGMSLQEELAQNTWDWQRLSALGPWQMAWGKLLGSTLPMWTLALVCAVLAQALAWWTYGEWSRPRGEGALPLLAELGQGQGQAHAAQLLWFIPKLALLAWLWGLALQAFAIASVPTRLDARRRNQPTLRVFLLLMLAWMVLHALLEDRSLPELLRWWGLPLGFFTAGWLFGLAALGLSLLALWRSMGMRLDVPMLPWAMPLGCAVTAAMLGGLAQEGWDAARWLTGTAALALACSLLTCQSQRETAFVQWRRVRACWAQRCWRAGLCSLPLWPVLWSLAALATLAIWAGPWQGGQGVFGANATTPAPTALLQQALPLLLLALLREAGFIHLRALQSAGGRRAGLGLGFVWVASGIVLPMMLLPHHAALALAFQPWLAPLLPEVRLDAWHWAVLGLQLAALALMLARAWHQRVAQLQG